MNLTEPYIIGIFIRGILYGVYLVTLAYCLRWLLYVDEGWKLRNVVNWVTLSTPLLIFILTTADLGVSLRLTLLTAQGNRLSYHKLVGISSVLEIASNLFIDIVLIYRCWIVYSKSRAIIYLPLLLWLGALALFIRVSYLSIVDLTAMGHSRAQSTRNTMLIAYLACNIAITTYGTSAIIYRIRSLSGSGLSATARILAESGLLYTLIAISTLLCTVLGKNLVILSLSCSLNSCITGIAFNLLQMRVGQQRADRLAGDARNMDERKSVSGLQFRVTDIESRPENSIYETKFAPNSEDAV